jgi:hypothetical protein
MTLPRKEIPQMSVIENTAELAPAGTWAADPVHSTVSFEVAYAGTSTFLSGAPLPEKTRGRSRSPSIRLPARIGRGAFLLRLLPGGAERVVPNAG